MNRPLLLLTVLFALTLPLALTPAAGFAADSAADKMAEPVAKEAIAPAAKEAIAPAAKAAPAPKAFFVDLKDGDAVTSPFTVKFGISGLEIAPAGTDKPNTGHFHLLVDTALTADEMKAAIPSDAQHLHFGKGQTETSVTLPAGKHTLQIVVGDGKHMELNPPVMSDKITVTVK